MKFQRVLSVDIRSDQSIADLVSWKNVDCKISKSDGTIIFEQTDVEVPEQWSQTSADMLASKYFRKAGVPDIFALGFVNEPHVPGWLLSHYVLDKSRPTGGETSAKQVFHRLAGCWTYHGWINGYFSSEEDAKIFYDECYLALAWQYAAPNSPQWFNSGLHWAYGISGPNSGQWAVNYKLSNDLPFVFQPTGSYEYPQPHACFIQPVDDSLVSSGGIMDLASKEALLFKYGSGTGTNFSSLRGEGEDLTGGGKSSGLMSFLRIGDVVAGAIKSGGTTRRAAKMVVVDMDHPEIEEVIDWKVVEDQKAASMYIGSQMLRGYYLDKGDAHHDPYTYIPQPMIDRMAQGFEPEIFGCGFEEPAINTVSGQNSNNSVRIKNSFFEAVANDESWELFARTTGKPVKKLKARYLWDKINRASWASADPGLQFHDTINEWHTCAADGEIRASNPCGEYNFLDNTACNLASLNLVRFLHEDGFINVKLYTHLCRIFTVILDISVQMASFPSREIAIGSYNYRTLGLGPANLGGLLMLMGLPYDSDEGRALAASLMSLMTGTAYLTSAEMAEELGAFPRWEVNKASMKRVLINHYKSILPSDPGVDTLLHDDISHIYLAVSKGQAENPVIGLVVCEAIATWNEVNRTESFRNAQVTLCAPTGTISFVMDCFTTGIEPEFSLVKYKKLAGGGNIKIVNPAVISALATLGYSDNDGVSIINAIEQGKSVSETCILPKDRAVFAVAVDESEGENVLRPMAHVLMAAAIQPQISGASSKTVNLPNSATIEDFAFIGREAHRLGIKSIAMYRYGCKLSQPLNVAKKDKPDSILNKHRPHIHNTDNDPSKNEVVEPHKLARGVREKLPNEVRTIRRKMNINGETVYLHTGDYPDGRLGEIFFRISKAGSTISGVMDCVSKLFSIALQYGVPLEELVDAFENINFEPSGFVQGHPSIKSATSIMDLIAHDVGIRYLDHDEPSNVLRLPGEVVNELINPTLHTHLHTPTGSRTSSWLESPPDVGNRHNHSPRITGNICPGCGNATLVRTGSRCQKCSACPYETGCG